MSESAQRRLVVIGNGMAGARVVEEILQRDAVQFRIAMFGAEPYGNYNRILLSNVLNRTQPMEQIFLNPLPWYAERGIALHAGVKALRIDRARKVVIGRPMDSAARPYDLDGSDAAAADIEVPYDHVIIATGSRPFVPPMDGMGKVGTFLFRTIDDCDRIAAYAEGCRRAVVIGGGLLGLEAARGLLTHGVAVTVIEAAPQLMMAQLDADAAAVLKTTMEQMGVEVLLDTITTHMLGDARVTGLRFKDGRTFDTDMVVVSAGIRPITEIGGSSGLTVERGIVCDDQLRTNDPDIFAVGECVQHRGLIYGLVEPIWDQAKTIADVITGVNPSSAYVGSKLATKLKVMGVELASMGDVRTTQPGDDVVVYREPSRGVYKKLVVRDNTLVGAVLLGETDTAGVLTQMFSLGTAVPERRADLLFGTTSGAPILSVFDLPEHAQICNCNGVSKGQIKEAIQIGKCRSVSKVGACTKAGMGCGSCKPLIQQFLEVYGGEVQDDDPSEHYYVPGVPLPKPELIAAIRARRLISVSAVFRELAGGREDPASKPGLASLLKSLWPDEYDDERDARYINDRVHANIQRDGTFSVIPRIYGGVTSAAELRRIADVADKYDVPMVKITGGQRIDLLGVKKDQLPAMWKDLGIPSGHAYTKAFRTCKSCVGTDFCRYGLGDSIALAQQIERRFQGVESPHKMKLATAGCPRNCSEAYVKDLGAVAIGNGKWEIYLGGAAGGTVRKGDLLCTVDSHADVLKYMGRFMQYYREHAKYMERSYGFVERLGIAHLRDVLVSDSQSICAHLDAEIEAAVAAYRDPWATDAAEPAYEAQFTGALPVMSEQEEARL
ncbi:MAG: NAD(P)/FAD-dependent oxidoreductase [Deltaproteobacteria bacterium]|nr:NAD(P)/FAD-dependent oxidoreductase [Deltaproteobacteria bacterium]MBI3389564.1 NAD(P)/FAD-dependent oxidoreductase [Deltaproteobacteria bacterium]